MKAERELNSATLHANKVCSWEETAVFFASRQIDPHQLIHFFQNFSEPDAKIGIFVGMA